MMKNARGQVKIARASSTRASEINDKRNTHTSYKYRPLYVSTICDEYMPWMLRNGLTLMSTLPMYYHSK